MWRGVVIGEGLRWGGLGGRGGEEGREGGRKSEAQHEWAGFCGQSTSLSAATPRGLVASLLAIEIHRDSQRLTETHTEQRVTQRHTKYRDKETERHRENQRD